MSNNETPKLNKESQDNSNSRAFMVRKSNLPTAGSPEYYQKLAQEEILDNLTLNLIERIRKGERINFGELSQKYPSQVIKEVQGRLADYWLEDRSEIQELEAEQVGSQDLTNLLNSPQERARARNIVEDIAAIVAAERSANAAKISDVTATNTQKVENNSSSQEPEKPIENLFRVAAAKNIKPQQLAQQLGISLDIMTKLNQKAIKWVGLPKELVNRLSQVLEVSISQLESFFSNSSASPVLGGAYHLNKDKPTSLQQQDFATVVQKSPSLPKEQREYWLKEIEKSSF